jgi:phage tail protein X
MAKRIYISTDMDRWDSLAYDFYGDASLVAPLMAANPQILPGQVLLPAGAKIVVPEITVPEQKETTIKAPWK